MARLAIEAKSDTGRVREHNEDNFGYDANIGLAVLADGMGGYRAGEVASAIAVTSLMHTVFQLLGDRSENIDGTQPDQARILQKALSHANQQVFNGGPVEEDRGFVLHDFTGKWDSTLKITDSLAITTSRDILEAIAQDKGPEQSLVALGYAGWGSGQLEQELADNAWLSGPADADILFSLPVEQRWEAAARAIGVDLNLLSSTAGHA